MAATAEKTDPGLWDKIKGEILAGEKGGKSGQWSARKAQLASAEYKKAGGGYRGAKSSDNHLQEWTDEKWGTRSGGKSEDTGERYLPEKAREHLSADEYRRTSDKKRRDTKAGRQFSAQPKDVAEKTAPYRTTSAPTRGDASRATLYAEAKGRGIPGRSKMSRAELKKALAE